MKPRVFLSHSKKDREYIEELATDLRSARIDVWYDDWEIPPGTSLRAKIFEEGITECDLFFIYLTKNSRDSSWVRRELDAAFVLELEKIGGFIAIFVDSDDTRQSLSPDLRSLRIPTINSENYSRCLLELTAKSWEALLRKRIVKANETNNTNIIRLEKKIVELDLELTKLKLLGAIDRDKILQELTETIFDLDGHSISFVQIFQSISENLARGVSSLWIGSLIGNACGLTASRWNELKGDLESEVIGKLVILGLAKVQPPVGSWDEIFYLTDLGIELALEIKCQSKENQND